MEVGEHRLGQPLHRRHTSTASEEKDKSRLVTVNNNIILGMSLILRAAMFSAGLAMLKNCPSQRLIPIYFTVAGALGIMIGTAILVNGPRLSMSNIINGIEYVLRVVDFIWMVLDLYWIFSVFKEYYYSDYKFKCSESLDLFAIIFAITHGFYFIYLMIAL